MTGLLIEKLQSVDVLILDVDGVLTDGRVIYSDAGQEFQAFHVRDGSGLALWKRAGKRAATITGRGSKALERRAAELGLDPVEMHAHDKGAALARVLATLGTPPERVAAVGDDLPDLPVFRGVGVRFAVADAVAEIKAAADCVVTHAGGHGAVREVVEIILKAQGRWQELVERF